MAYEYKSTWKDILPKPWRMAEIFIDFPANMEEFIVKTVIARVDFMMTKCFVLFSIQIAYFTGQSYQISRDLYTRL